MVKTIRKKRPGGSGGPGNREGVAFGERPQGEPGENFRKNQKQLMKAKCGNSQYKRDQSQWQSCYPERQYMPFMQLMMVFYSNSDIAIRRYADNCLCG